MAIPLQATKDKSFTVKVTGTISAFSNDHAIAKIASYLRSVSGEQPLPSSTQSDFDKIRVEVYENH